MTKLKSNDHVKDFSEITERDWNSLRSCDSLQSFYPFAQGQNYQIDCMKYKTLLQEQLHNTTYMTAVVPTASDKPAKKPFEKLTKAEYKKLYDMGLLWVAYPEASGNYNADFPPKPQKVRLYVHGDTDTIRETGEELGLTGDALQQFSHCLYEVEIMVLVNMVTGAAEIIGCDGNEFKTV